MDSNGYSEGAGGGEPHHALWRVQTVSGSPEWFPETQESRHLGRRDTDFS